MKRKNFKTDGEMKKLLNELSTKDAAQVKGGSPQEAKNEVRVGVTIYF